MQKLENPISFVILFEYLKNIVLDEKRVIKILENFIESVRNRQQYEFIDSFWLKTAKDMFELDFENFESTSKSYYRKISIKALDSLSHLFERSGNFMNAILVNRYLYEINPNKYALNISSLYERMGNMQKAFEILPKELKIENNKKPSDLEVRYYQRKAAFVIISSQDETKKAEGVESLKTLEKFIFSHNEENEPLWLWHFYNISANLCEWEKDYEKAINLYKKCLKVPSLGHFEYGATFVNMAISYRFLYTLTKNKSDIDKAIKYGKVGLNLKELVGEKDEMAIVYHNLALTMLYKIADDFELNLCNEAYSLASDALVILDRTNSKKRLGMVLIENYILATLLEKDNKEFEDRLKNSIKDFSNAELENMKKLYTKFKDFNNKFILNL